MTFLLNSPSIIHCETYTKLILQRMKNVYNRTKWTRTNLKENLQELIVSYDCTAFDAVHTGLAEKEFVFFIQHEFHAMKNKSISLFRFICSLFLSFIIKISTIGLIWCIYIPVKTFNLLLNGWPVHVHRNYSIHIYFYLYRRKKPVYI